MEGLGKNKRNYGQENKSHRRNTNFILPKYMSSFHIFVVQGLSAKEARNKNITHINEYLFYFECL
jgi:hypothetical protein